MCRKSIYSLASRLMCLGPIYSLLAFVGTSNHLLFDTRHNFHTE